MAVLNHGIISSAPEEAEEAAEFSVDSSLKFDGSSELLRAISTAGSLTTFTIAFWVKRGELGTRQVLFSSSNTGGNDQFWTEFSPDNRFRWLINNGDNTVDADMYSTRVFRDPSAWYHIAILVDTTADNGDRMKLYVNGELETQTGTEIPSSYNIEWNDISYDQYIGDWSGGNIQFDGYLADVYHIDGQAIAPLGNFIETSETTGQLIPKEYTGGHYGTNGFHLNLSEGHDSEILINSAHREGSVNFEDSSGSDHNDLISYQNGDVSGNDPQHSIRAGNPFTGTDRAIYLDGDGDYLSAPHSSEFNFGTGDFTLESWVNTGAYSSDDNFGIMGHIFSSGGQDGWLWWVDGSGSMRFYDSESGGNIYSPDGTFSSAIENRWNHVAAVRKSGVIYLYLNGDVVGSGANTETLDHTRTLTVGRSYENRDDYYFTGYMYDTRIVKGTAVYDGSFDRPTEKLTNISGTSLLIQPDDDDATVADRTGTHTITNNNISLPATASTPYESVMKRSAIRFQCDGTSASQVDNKGVIMTGGSGYVTHSDFQLTTNETYTAEAWVYIEAIPFSVYTALFGNWSNNQNGWLMETWLDSGTTYWAFYDSASSVGNHVKTSTEVVLDKWHHVAVVKYSGNTGDTSIYLNGVRIEDSFQSNSTGGGIFSIGNYENGYNKYGLKGYMYDVRFTKGVTRYTGTTYDVPENPFVTGKLTHPGADSSGKKNHFDVEGHAGWDVVGDSPGPGKNFCTWNPLDTRDPTISEGNLTIAGGSAFTTTAGTFAVSADSATVSKWIFDVRIDGFGSASMPAAGVTDVEDTLSGTSFYVGQNALSWGLYTGSGDAGNLVSNGSATGTDLTSWAVGDSVVVAVDMDSKKGWFGQFDDSAGTLTWANVDSAGTGNPATGANPSFTWTASGLVLKPVARTDAGATVTANFGADATYKGQESPSTLYADDNNEGVGEFRFSVPAGFKSLCTANLVAPGVNNAVASEQVFTAVTWEGDGSSASDEVDVPASFNPDLIWAKQRTTDPQQHTLIDSGRGIGAKVLDSATAGGMYEGTGYGVIQNNTTGFEATSGMTDGYSYFNVSGEDYVAWLWKKSAAAGFDIVTWEGNESDPNNAQPRTVDYSLGNSPAEMIIAKDFLGSTNWWVYHKDLTYNGNDPHSTAILLNEGYEEGDFDGASGGSTTGIWGDTAPGDASFTVKDDSMSGYSLNTPPSSTGQDNYVAYCFRSIDGHSKVGSYTGNSSTNGPFIYCGFRPAYVIIKVISTTSSWHVLDTTRDPHNYADRYLLASDTNIENQASTLKIDFLSNGLKLRGDGTGTNTGNTYIFYAVAESPFKYASAR